MQGCWGSVSEYFYFIEVFFNTITGCVDKPGVNQPVSFLSPSYFRMVSCMTTQLSFLICPGIPLPPFPLTTRPILWHGHLPAVGCPCSCSDSVLESCLLSSFPQYLTFNSLGNPAELFQNMAHNLPACLCPEAATLLAVYIL